MTYPIFSASATSSLDDLLRQQIRARGPLGFDDFMATALYHPEFGYYAHGTHQTGRGGDFFTSVSVGPLFGMLLARRFLRHWHQIGRPPHWRIIECGAHDGTLARDVLDALITLEPQAFETLNYIIADPLPNLRAAQHATLARFAPHVLITEDLTPLALAPLPGIAFGNELLDALPFHVVTRDHQHWLERTVGLSSNNQLIWQTQKTTPALDATLDLLGNDFADGYTTEIRTCISDFLTNLTKPLDRGLMLWIDYGFARPEYYDPARTTGTLRTFANHRAGDNPLDAPGQCDITAHVDFTAVATCAATLGYQPLDFRSQGSWMLDQARDWLLEQEGIPNNNMLRQFQTLTHPAHLGAKFHVLELTADPTMQPVDAHAINHRLAL